MIRQICWFYFFGSILLAQDVATKLIDLEEVSELKILEDEGEAVRVRGFVERTNTNATGINFLDFKGTDFVCVTFGRHLSSFPDGGPAEIYNEKWIEVSGKIENYRGNPQIRIESPDQVKIIDEPAPKPPEPEPVVVVEEPKKEEVVKPKPAPAPEPVAKDGRQLEMVNGVPAVDWRKYFPE